MNIKEDRYLAELAALNKLSVDEAHEMADDVLLQALTELGAVKVVEAYKELRREKGFYYA